MLFCCIWRNVETSCHKHFVVASRHQQTPPLVPAIIVTTCGTAVRRRRLDNTWPVAALTMQHAVKPAQNRDFCLPRLHSMPPTRTVWLADGENFFTDMFILFDSTAFTNVTDRQTDRQTRSPHDDIGRACSIARQNCNPTGCHHKIATSQQI